MNTSWRFPRWGGYAVALVLTTAITGVIALTRLRGEVANISMLYLLAVLASAVMFGSGPAIVAACAAFLELNVLFLEPRYRLAVADPGEWVALVLLLVTGVITGQLAAAIRNRAQEAERREREAIVLYDAVRLMAGADVTQALTAVAERLRVELGMAAVLIDMSGLSPPIARAEAGAPMLTYIDMIDRADPGAYVTVVLPEFVPAHVWQGWLHNQSAGRLKRALRNRPNTVVINVPYHLPI